MNLPSASDRPSPEILAEALLGRRFEELEEDEQSALHRVAAGTLIELDADEVASLHVSRGDRLADRVAAVGGSWGFIIAFGVVLVVWMLANSRLAGALGFPTFDSYPYIFLNLMLSMLAAIQAPVIMMSQNRQAAKDRIAARHDHEVNLRAQLEIMRLHLKLDRLIDRIGQLPGSVDEGQGFN